jgi:hypothetical protein
MSTAIVFLILVLVVSTGGVICWAADRARDRRIPHGSRVDPVRAHFERYPVWPASGVLGERH